MAAPHAAEGNPAGNCIPCARAAALSRLASPPLPPSSQSAGSAAGNSTGSAGSAAGNPAGNGGIPGARAAALSQLAEAAAAGASGAADVGPCPHETHLSLYHAHVHFELIPPGTFAKDKKVQTISEAIHGKVYAYRWDRTRPPAHAQEPLVELDRAIQEVQNAIQANDTANLLEFLRELPCGGGLLRTTLQDHSWQQGNFARPPDLQQLQDELAGDREKLIGQNTDRKVVGKSMPGKNVRMNVNCEENDCKIHFHQARRHCEDAMTEIGVLSYLRQQEDLPMFLLRMVGVFIDDNDHVTMATEYVDSELFSQVAAKRLALPEDRMMRYTWQLLQATAYLHAHRIGHRDISLENILLSFGETIDGRIRLMDFGQAVSTHTPDGTQALRYFGKCSKNYYRPPEGYLPCWRATARQIIPDEALVKAPDGAEPGQVVMGRMKARDPRTGRIDFNGYLAQVRLITPVRVDDQELWRAVVWGYEVMPLDVFACGVSLFILAFKAPPWTQAVLADQSFNYICRPLAPGRHDSEGALRNMLQGWKREPLPPSAMQMLAAMLSWDPSRRPTVQDCLQARWFASMAGVEVPRH